MGLSYLSEGQGYLLKNGGEEMDTIVLFGAYRVCPTGRLKGT